MIRQAINCDVCGAEKQASNYWFVAYEQGGELKLRGWESPQNSRKHVKHLCGQKCAQRQVANFLASLTSLTSSTHGAEAGKEGASEGQEMVEQIYEEVAAVPERQQERAAAVRAPERGESRTPDRSDRSERSDRTDRSLLNATPARQTVAAEGDWVGPVRFKEDAWDRPERVRIEHEPFVNGVRARTAGRLQRSA